MLVGTAVVEERLAATATKVTELAARFAHQISRLNHCDTTQTRVIREIDTSDHFLSAGFVARWYVSPRMALSVYRNTKVSRCIARN